jgi:hypothetical protein
MDTADVSIYPPDVGQVMGRALELEAGWRGLLGEGRRGPNPGKCRAVSMSDSNAN